jgi:predicted membrane-bound mannosyltransferase
MFAFYAGFVSVLGYPLGTDVFGAWIVVHAVVPLAIPASVGIGRLYRWGREARIEGDDIGAALAAVVLVVLAGLVGVSGAGAVAPDHDRSNSLVQYAQPGDDLDPLIAAMDRSTREPGDGSDVVLYYGSTGDDRDDGQAIVGQSSGWQEGDLLTKPPCAEWFNTLPLPWYFQTTGANVTCETDPGALADGSGTQHPGVIIAVEEDDTVPRNRLANAGYESRPLLLRSYGYTVRAFVHQRIGGI